MRYHQPQWLVIFLCPNASKEQNSARPVTPMTMDAADSQYGKEQENEQL